MPVSNSVTVITAPRKETIKDELKRLEHAADKLEQVVDVIQTKIQELIKRIEAGEE